MNTRSPFVYGSTVSGSAFTNREEELERLTHNLTHGVNTMIISPRRWGKSSLVEHALADLAEHEEFKIVSLDLFAFSTEEEFLLHFAKEVIKASSSKWEEWVASGKAFFKQLVPKISLGIDPQQDFTISLNWQDIQQHKDEILNLPEVIAAQKNTRFIICLDEFQNLAAFNNFEQLEKQMRSIWQRQKRCSYCLYGSKRHMMTDIFNNASKPFYRFGDVINLGKIKRERWVTFIQERFIQSDKDISEDASMMIPEAMRDHSWYVQQLAHYTWHRTDKRASKETVSLALKELIQANSPFYQLEVERLSKTQRHLLKAIAMGERQLTSHKVMSAYRLGTPNNVRKNKLALMANDLIEARADEFLFLDPGFEMWFRQVVL